MLGAAAIAPGEPPPRTAVHQSRVPGAPRNMNSGLDPKTRVSYSGLPAVFWGFLRFRGPSLPNIDSRICCQHSLLSVPGLCVRANSTANERFANGSRTGPVRERRAPRHIYHERTTNGSRTVRERRERAVSRASQQAVSCKPFHASRFLQPRWKGGVSRAPRAAQQLTHQGSRRCGRVGCHGHSPEPWYRGFEANRGYIEASSRPASR